MSRLGLHKEAEPALVMPDSHSVCTETGSVDTGACSSPKEELLHADASVRQA